MAVWRRCTSPGPGAGTSMDSSRITSGPPNSCSCTARAWVMIGSSCRVAEKSASPTRSGRAQAAGCAQYARTRWRPSGAVPLAGDALVAVGSGEQVVRETAVAAREGPGPFAERVGFGLARQRGFGGRRIPAGQQLEAEGQRARQGVGRGRGTGCIDGNTVGEGDGHGLGSPGTDSIIRVNPNYLL